MSKELCPKRPDVYVREATGLVRSFSWFDMFVYNSLGLNLGIVLSLTVLTGAWLFPGADMSVAVTVGMILCLFNGLTYGLMSGALPRAGGDYVWVSHTINPLLGFVGNWGEMASCAFATGMYAAMTASFGMSASFASLGTITSAKWLVDLGSLVATPNYTYGLGTLFIFLPLVFYLLGPRITKLFFLVTFVGCMLGVVATAAILFGASHQTFVTQFNALTQQYTNSTDSYDAIIATAKNAGGTIPTVSLGASLAALPLGFWSYLGFANSNWVSGEVKNPSRSQPLAMMGSVLFAWIFYVLMFWKFYDVVGWNFTNAIAYLFYAAPSQYVLPAPPVFNFLVGLLVTNPLLNALIGLSFILWIFMLSSTIPLVGSRVLFSWAFTRVIPEAFAKVDKRGSPWVALIVGGIFSQIFLTVYVYTGALGLVNFSIISCIIFFIGGLSAVLLPYLPHTNALFEASPGIVKKRIAGVPLLVIAGIVNEIFFAFAIIFSIENPAFSGPVGVVAYEMLALIFFSGAIVWVIAYMIRKKQGINLMLMWKEVPPE